MICTTIEQSKKLIKLRLNVRTADMLWIEEADGDYRLGVLNNVNALAEDEIPAWSLSALLDEIPQSIITDDGDEYILQMSKEDDITYVFGYKYRETSTIVVDFVSQEAVETAYELVCWLLENKYN